MKHLTGGFSLPLVRPTSSSNSHTRSTAAWASGVGSVISRPDNSSADKHLRRGLDAVMLGGADEVFRGLDRLVAFALELLGGAFAGQHGIVAGDLGECLLPVLALP